jgi:alpha-N-arabinofuranosidase
MEAELAVISERVLGQRDPMIYGHFIEHFHRQIYGGIYDPGSPLSDAAGLRRDVCDAIRALKPPIIRWPGGCYVSAYHWEDGIGSTRSPRFDKAWRVEESNAFGTDEFIGFCRNVGAEPYICTNAGSGTSEEMSNWVEYCNLTEQGKWARLRKANGYAAPHNVRYWSIGNENYGDWEIGAKTAEEWARFVKESGKMMKAVDPSIELMAASVAELDWNFRLLREAGKVLDWISIHGYWDPLWERNDLSSYETSMALSATIAPQIATTEHILGALGLLGKIRIAFDEWNLRGWHHPNRWSATEDFLSPRDKNDLNSTYTMADAVFTACFLNECLRHCRTVGMANFAPLVNARGLIFTQPGGIVLRSTYFVFQLFTQHMGDVVLDSWLTRNADFSVTRPGGEVLVPAIDAVATRVSGENAVRIAVVNRHPEKPVGLTIRGTDIRQFTKATVHTLGAPSKDSYNDTDTPDAVVPGRDSYTLKEGDRTRLDIAPHSVSVIVLS